MTINCKHPECKGYECEKPFTMSIETTEGKSYQHGFHLGTIDSLARELVEERFKARRAANMPTVTIGLMRDGKLIDVFYGNSWHFENGEDMS